MNKGILTIVLIFSIFINNILSQDINLRNIDITKFKEKCYARFCKSGNDSACKERMKNIELLANFIKNDERLNNIGIASFFFATVYTETEVKNFNPTEEIGKGKGTDYGNPDKETGQVYYGRGWVQLTHKENYKKATNELGIDFLNKPNLVLEPKNAYEIMYLSTINGWLETYRSSIKGTGGNVPIKITDFLNENGKLDYSLTRAVINANAIGKTPKRFEFKSGYFIPTYKYLDASKKNKDISIFFEDALLYSLGKEIKDEIKLLPLIEHNNTPSAGCFVQDDKDNVYCQLSSTNGYYFNLIGIEQEFEEITNKNVFPKGFDYGFQRGNIFIFIKKNPLKKEDEMSCITPTQFQIIIRVNKKEFKQKLGGFCGC